MILYISFYNVIEINVTLLYECVNLTLQKIIKITDLNIAKKDSQYL